jgi:CTP:molybdopterin cytidylyltransferase MocA
MIPAIVLAGGKSTRMGRPKATLPLGPSQTFLGRIVRTFEQAGVEDVLVVLGHEPGPVEASLAAQGLWPRIVLNPDYEQGQLSSLLAGLRVADRPGVEAVLVTLVDVPLVAAETVRAVRDRFVATRVPIVRPVQGDRHGHPVLVSRALFDAIRAADPERGAKPVIRAGVSATGDVEVADEGAFFDVDTPEDYTRALAGL